MAGLTGRMSTVIKAKVSKLLDRAEDPSETLDYSYQKQVEQLQNVKKGIADVVTAKKRLQMQESSLQQSVVKLDTQARQALAGGNEELARAALERKNVAQTELQGLDTQVTELEQQQEKLTDSEKKLRAKIEAFRTKKEVIKAQYSAAEAQVRISEAATGVGEQMADVGLAMQRAVDKTENMRARADAVSRARSGRHLRRHHPDRLRRRRHRPPAQAALQPARRRRRPGEAEERTRSGGASRLPRSPPAAPEQAGQGRVSAMIVRISGEDQYRLDDGEREKLNQLEERVVGIVESGAEDGFRDAFATLLQFVRDNGERVAADDIESSDVILPPSDVTFAEAGSDFTGEGLIPD